MTYENTLYYGDNLSILKHLSKQPPFIDLIYIDPPFNSKRNYNILYTDLVKSKKNGEKTTALKEAFKDTWSSVEISLEIDELKRLGNLNIYNFLQNNRPVFTDSQMSYLTMMSIRIYYMQKVLKDTGSFYLHCDPTMSHYLKILCDMIFGVKNFRNEITWKRHGGHSLSKKSFNNISDIILFYSKVEGKNYFITQSAQLSEEELSRRFSYVEKETGRRYQHSSLEQTSNKSSRDEIREIQGKKLTTDLGWKWTQETMDKRLKKNPHLIHWTKNNRPRYKVYLDEYKGEALGNFWNDVPYLSSANKERLGYPTQKPETLLQRIIKVSSKKGDVVADFFCGCGTTVAVAQKLKRKWLGVDISHLAIGLIEDKRLKNLKSKYEIKGFPSDLASAEKLAKEKHFEFEQWVVEYKLKGHQTRKTGDGGYDGHLSLDYLDKDLLAIIEVKGGSCGVAQLRSFFNVVEKNENVDMGIFICFKKYVTDGMRKLCDDSGFIDMDKKEKFLFEKLKKLGILTIEELLENKEINQFKGLTINKTY